MGLGGGLYRSDKLEPKENLGRPALFVFGLAILNRELGVVHMCFQARMYRSMHQKRMYRTACTEAQVSHHLVG